MRNIVITQGAYGHRPEGSRLTETKTADDGSFAVSDEEAARLVGLKVARYADSEEIPVTGVATPEGGGDGTGEGDNPPGDDGGAEGREAAREKPEYGADTGFDDLKELLAACGLKFVVGMSKVDIIAALDEYYGGGDTGDDEAPPNLSPEDPVT